MKKVSIPCECIPLKGKCECTPGTEGVCFCSIEGIMGVISKKWALLIITIIGNFGRLRYSELEAKMTGISPKTLSDRLKELEKANLIKRETFAQIPPRVEYTLTPEGEELRDALVPLITWASSRDSQKLYKLV
jgi:DNA-binding HxlR family transcriptional regulator